MAAGQRDVLAKTGDPLMSDENDKSFVNRHGHKMGGSLETSPVTEPFRPTTPEVSKPAEVKKVRARKRSKKPLVIIAVVAVLLLLIPVIGGELVRARYLTTRDNAHKQLVEFATKTIVPQQKKQMKLAQLSEATRRVDSIRDDACDGGFNDNLASLYPRAKDAYDQCIAFKHKVDVLASGLHDLESQVRYLESLAPILTPIAKGDTDRFAIISAQHENWKAFDEALGKLSPAASQRATHEQLKTQSKTIVAAWSALNTANNDQDASGFTAAEKKLSDSYEAFRASSASLSTTLSKTERGIAEGYKGL